jgi:hypothetical protein
VGLPRLQLFEFNDAPWVPRPVREVVIEALSRLLSWGGVLRALVGPFEDFVARAGVSEVLDLASGAGGPARILIEEILRAGRVPPRFLLTDLHPHPDSWAEACAAHPGIIDFVPDPVDATHIPEALARGRARVIVNAFHHLPPEVARGVLADAVRSRSPIFLAEGFERDPRGFAPMIPYGLPALLASPLLSPRDRLAKAAFVWASAPAALGIAAWDGVVSTLRVYDRADLMAMVEPLGGGFTWTYGTYDFPFGGRGTFFHGVPGSPGPG